MRPPAGGDDLFNVSGSSSAAAGLELPWFSGHVVTLGREMNVPTPCNRAVNDGLLERLHANKPELLMVLDRARMRCTPTVRSATFAATSSSARSAAGPAAVPAVIAATRFLV